MSKAGRNNMNKKAILVAHFGTTYPNAVGSLSSITRAIKERFPGIPLRIAFTSNIIRGIWAERNQSPQEWLDQGVPAEILGAKSLLGALGELQNDGFRTILVQPTLMAHGEQYQDLLSYITGLNSIKTIKQRWMPFEKLVCARPILGTHGVEFDYKKDLEETALALKDDFDLAQSQDASLVYVGHGNEFMSSGIYLELEKVLRSSYPSIPCFVGMAEGFPGFEDVIDEIKSKAKPKLLLKPLMITAGDHAHTDIAGPEEDSWLSQLSKEGFEVTPIFEGLGSKGSIARMIARRLEETAKHHGINLLEQDQEG